MHRFFRLALPLLLITAAAAQPPDTLSPTGEATSSSPHADTTMKFMAGDNGAHPPAGATVEFVIDGFEHDRGSAILALYTSEEAFPHDTTGVLAGADVPIRDGRVEHRFENVPPGRYAMIFFHDEDGDKELDFNWLHIPKEGYGTSGERKVTIPDWDHAVFEVERDTVRQTLGVTYW